MKPYGSIDLHSNNSVVGLIDQPDRVVFDRRTSNKPPFAPEQLSPYQSAIEGIVVQSTFNWYWQVDGLMDAGYEHHLANPTAIQRYEGLNYTDDYPDVRWLAYMLRLRVLPEGYISPKGERAG